MKLLLAEDDADMARALSALLQKNHYTVDTVDNGEDALYSLLEGDYDGAVLDIMMPVLDGLSAVAAARKKGIRTPVMMLTALGEVEDRIAGLDAGADDYLPKPFDGGEFLARVRALLRRTESYQADLLRFGDLSLDRNSCRLSCGGHSIALGNKGFQMMEMLMLSHGTVLSTNRFMEHIWGWDSDAEVNVVWVNISLLRKQLKELGSRVSIRAVRGAGYTLADGGAGEAS